MAVLHQDIAFHIMLLQNMKSKMFLDLYLQDMTLKKVEVICSCKNH